MITANRTGDGVVIPSARPDNLTTHQEPASRTSQPHGGWLANMTVTCKFDGKTLAILRASQQTGKRGEDEHGQKEPHT